MLAHVASLDGFLPHGFCYRWQSSLIWLHAVSDILIGLAYVSIPVTLFHLIRRRKDIPFGWMFMLFATFITACGATHFMEVWTLWVPDYWLSGGVKAITAIASVPTAVLLVRLMPTALSMPSRADMVAANAELLRSQVFLAEGQRLSQTGTWAWSASSGELWWSQELYHLLGLDPEKTRPSPEVFWQRVHPEDRPLLAQVIDRAIREQSNSQHEFRVVLPDGSVRYLESIGHVVEISFGEAEEKSRRTFTGFIRDITEHKRAEAALRESEDRYRDLVENSSDLICTHDAQGILLSVNEAPLRVLGYSRDELVNKPLRDFVTPEERPLCDAYLARVQRDGFAKGLLPVLTKSGEVRLWEYNNSVRKEGVSSPIVRGMAHDVTEQKRAEAALRRSEEKFYKVFHSSPVEMFITTLEEGRFLDINETFERNTGYTRDELIGCTKLELGLWVEPAERAAIVEEVKKNGRVIAREIQIRSKSGEIGTKLCSAELLKIGREQCLLAVCEDITDRKRAQEVLLRSEAFLAAGQRLSHTGSWAWNPNSGELFWSVETFRIFGFDPAATKPTVEIFLQSVHREDRPILEQVLDRVVREKCDMEVDYRIVLANGSVKYIHGVALPIFDSSGGLTEFVGTVIDVTDRKETEEELRRLSGQLLQLHDEERRSIARDLHDSTGQNLVALATILGQLHSSIPSSNRKSCKLISRSQALTKRCIREVRTLSYVLYPPMLDEAGLEVAVGHFRDGFEERTGISVELEISPRFKRLPREAELALFRVVQESLANIQRHSGSPSAKVLLARQPGMVLLEVSDKSCRICVNERKRPGTFPFNIGVGIASMQERVKQVGGRLEIESNTSGTTVRATIPADD